MRLGVSLAQAGRLADPASVRSAATAAEQMGYASVWVSDCLAPPTSAPASDRRCTGSPADEMVATLDPLSVLTYAAAVTTRVRLGTSVLVAPWYRPSLLARSLRSLDVLSEGRLTVGLGLGWPLDEYAALGVPEHELGRRLDDALDLLDALATGPAVASPGDGGGDGDAGASPIVPGAAPRTRPPVLLAAYTPAGLDRVARRADGWNPSGLPVEQLAPLWAQVRDLAAGHGREPDALELVVRADITVSEQPIDGERPSYAGTVEQVAADIADTRRAGAHEVILGVRGDHGLDQALDTYARIAETVDATAMA
jgi:probable F420-dependent oxidoreductase